MRHLVPASALFQPLVLLALLIAGFFLLLPGNSGLSIYSGKDEYFLSMRVVLSMHELDLWWIPMLDGEPRLRKPPGLYWSARAVYELCGTSMFCLRLPAMFWALGWLASVCALTAWLFPRQALTAQVVAGIGLMLSVGWLIEGRRLMLDLPVSACASFALWSSLRGIAPHLEAIKMTASHDRHLSGWRPVISAVFWWALAGCFLAYGFLIKGPVVWLIWGSGVLAMSFHPKLFGGFTRGFIDASRLRFWGSALISFFLGIALASRWFVDAAAQSQALGDVLDQEVQARLLGEFSLAPLWGFWLISAPWGLSLLWTALRMRGTEDGYAGTIRSLSLWIVLSLLPFFIMKTFERYLLGSLVPLALMAAAIFVQGHGRENIFRIKPWLRLLSALPMLLICALIASFLIWFRIAPMLGALNLLTLAAFVYLWLASSNTLRLVAAMLLWLLNVLMFVSMTYPSLGVNHAPEWLVEHARKESVVFWNGPHPALLAAYTGRSHRHIGSERDGAVDQLEQGQWFVVLQSDRASLDDSVNRRGWTLTELGQWRALVNHGSALRFWPAQSDWRKAIAGRDLSLLQSDVLVLRLEKRK